MTPTWNIHIAYADPQPADPDRLELISSRLALFDAAVSHIAGVLHIDMSVESDDPLGASHRALTVSRELLDDEVTELLALEARSDAAMDAELDTPPLPDLLGSKEVADRLAISKQRLHQLLTREDFPDPVIRLAAGPVWLADSISAFERSWQRRPGRPSSSARAKKPFVRQAG